MRRLRQSSTRRGVVLLVVLAAIVVAGVALSSLATQSVARVRQADDAAVAVQRRWAERSIERMMLRQAEGIFRRRDEAAAAGIEVSSRHQVRLQLPFGEQMFDVIVADEDSKANLNLLYHAGDRRAVEQAIETLGGPGARSIATIRPLVPPQPIARTEERADDDGDEESAVPPLAPAFTTWADVFDIAAMRQQTGDARTLATLSGRMTLWGGGQLNVRRADAETLQSVIQAVVPEGQARLLVERLTDGGLSDLGLLIDRTVKSPQRRRELKRMLGAASVSHSVWIESASPHGRTQSFAVQTTDGDGTVRTVGFRL